MKKRLWLEQTIESRWRTDGYDYGIRRATWGVCPIGRREQGGLLQDVTGRVGRPRNGGIAGSRGNNCERRCANGLDDGWQCPKTAGDGILTVRHRSACIMLADRSADGINATGASAATAVNR